MASLTTFLELIDLVLGEAAYGAYTDWGAVQDRDNSILESAIKDLGGPTTAGGTANALTVTAGVGYTTFQNGRIIGFVGASDNTAAATLNVNGLGVKAIRKMTLAGEAALSGGEIKAGGIYLAVYNSAFNAAAGGWMLLNDTPTVPTLGTPQATTSGSTKDFTGIPAWAKKITLSLNEVQSSSDSFMTQLGDSGGIESAGYTGGVSYFTTTDQLTSATNSSYAHRCSNSSSLCLYSARLSFWPSGVMRDLACFGGRTGPR